MRESERETSNSIYNLLREKDVAIARLVQH